jgi:hypothetical protein
MRFRYRLIRSNQPILPLGGRFVRPRPILTVTIVGPTGSWAEDALLDTAADDTVFPEVVAQKIGLDLTHAPQGSGTGAGFAGVPLLYARVSLRLTDGREYRQWTAWVGFTSAPLPYPMLGFAGCLQFFSVLCHGDREEVELTINSLYPGT